MGDKDPLVARIVNIILHGWHGDINNDGKVDTVKYRTECKEIDGGVAVTTASRYVINLGGVEATSDGQFKRIYPNSGNEYIYTAAMPSVRFFTADGSASFVPNQWVIDKTTRKVDKITGFVIAIFEGEPMGPIEAQLKSGAMRKLEDLMPAPFLEGIFRFFNF